MKQVQNYLQDVKNQVQEAARVLKAGGIVAFPTFTSYGLAVDAKNEKAVRKLYKLKGRSYVKPIHVIVENMTEAKKIAKFNGLAEEIAKTYWPGSLTLVLPLKSKSASWKLLSAGTGTIGIRIPDHNVIADLLKVCHFPITATSANISGKPDPYSVKEIQKMFAKSKTKPDFYIDAGTLTRRKPSTVVQIENRHVTLLREGPVSFHDLLKNLHLNVPAK
jgi:L-threonylcarbamoyladenylate synthase